ncbi:MAG: hypothetical protein ACOCXM_01600 [Myxococcota bacterium]
MGNGWIDDLDPRAGPLAAAARAFDRQHGPFDRGRAGLRRLAAVLDAAALDTEDEDRRFVEGAGALLALLLLDHLQEGAHCERDGHHRVRLGRRGTLDPFAAVEAILDAENVHRELARWVREAEDEARGDGPVARVVLAFEQALRLGRPERSLHSQFERQVVLDDGTEVDLDRLARVAETADASALHHAAERLVALLPGGGEGGAGLPFETVRERLLPRLVDDAFLSGLGEGASGLCTVGVGHDVHVALIVAFERRARFVRRDELDAWSLAPGDARRLALRNLADRSGRARFARLDTPHGPLLVARTGDGHDAARLLLPGLYDVLSAEAEPPLVAAVPHRDILMATSARDGAAVRDLTERAAEAAARAPHRISAHLFAVQPGGVSPFT